MTSPSYNNPPTGFSIAQTATGTSLRNTRAGVSTSQTPIVLSGIGPFTLTGDQFETALSTALVITGSSAAVQINLPSTATILSIMSGLSSNTSLSLPASATNQTYGTWVPLTLINENSNGLASITLVAGDGNTGLSQVACPALSACTYIIAQTLDFNSAFQVTVVQENVSNAAAQSMTVQNNAVQSPVADPAVVLYQVISFQNNSAQAAFGWNTATSVLTVQPGVTVLISTTTCFGTGLGGVTNLFIAPSGQTTSPITGAIAGSIASLNGTGIAADSKLSVVYTNATSAATTWSVYLSMFIVGHVVIAFNNVLTTMSICQIR